MQMNLNSMVRRAP